MKSTRNKVLDHLDDHHMYHPGAIKSSRLSKRLSLSNSAMIWTGFYVVAAIVTGVILDTFDDIGPSSLLTFSSLSHCFALLALFINSVLKESLSGVSQKSLQMQILVLTLRLSNTLWLKGYTPVDSTGNWFYQFLDCCTVMFAFWNIVLFWDVRRFGKQKAEGGWPIAGMFGVAVLLGAAVHPDLNNRPFFDGVWSASLYADMMSIVPQIRIAPRSQRWSYLRDHSHADSLCPHYVGLMGISKFIGSIFWLDGHAELGYENEFNYIGYSVLVAQVIQFLQMTDFVLNYSKLLDRRIGDYREKHGDSQQGDGVSKASKAREKKQQKRGGAIAKRKASKDTQENSTSIGDVSFDQKAIIAFFKENFTQFPVSLGESGKWVYEQLQVVWDWFLSSTLVEDYIKKSRVFLYLLEKGYIGPGALDSLYRVIEQVQKRQDPKPNSIIGILFSFLAMMAFFRSVFDPLAFHMESITLPLVVLGFMSASDHILRTQLLCLYKISHV